LTERSKIATVGSSRKIVEGISAERINYSVDAKTKASVLHDMIRRFGTGGSDITPADWEQFVEAQNDGYQTGPEIGERVPDFSLDDQNDKRWALNDLMGPKGLLLVFSRSADW
jgi:hypothetical protein